MMKKYFLASSLLLLLGYFILRHMKEQYDPEYVNLVTWIRAKGGLIKDTVLRKHFESNRYIIADRDFKKRELISEIPVGTIIHLDDDRVQAHCRQFELQNDELPCLTIFLYDEMEKENSDFKPYFDYLPKDYSTFPLFFTEEEMGYLKYSEVKTLREHFIDKYTKEVEYLQKRYQREIDLDTYIKRRIVVFSRDFSITKKGKHQRGLVPYADLYNSIPSKINTDWTYNEQRKAFLITAKTNIKKGDEIYTAYGSKSNLRYFFYYGYIIDNNSSKIDYSMGIGGILVTLHNPPNLKENLIYNKTALKAINHRIAEYDKMIEEVLGKMNEAEGLLGYNLSNISKMLKEEREVMKVNAKAIDASIEYMKQKNKKKQ